MIDTINELHSGRVTFAQLSSVREAVRRYLSRYEMRLAPKNLFYLRQLLSVLQRLLTVVERTECDGNDAYTLPAFAFSSKLDNTNLLKLVDFIEKSRLTHKLLGFIEVMKAEGFTDANRSGTAKKSYRNERNGSIKGSHRRFAEDVSLSLTFSPSRSLSLSISSSRSAVLFVGMFSQSVVEFSFLQACKP